MPHSLNVDAHLRPGRERVADECRLWRLPENPARTWTRPSRLLVVPVIDPPGGREDPRHSRLSDSQQWAASSGIVQ